MKTLRIGLLGLGLLLVGTPTPALAKDNTAKPAVRQFEASCTGGTIHFNFNLHNIGDADATIRLVVKVESGKGQGRKVETLENPPYGQIDLPKGTSVSFDDEVTAAAGAKSAVVKVRGFLPSRDKAVAKRELKLTCS